MQHDATHHHSEYLIVITHQFSSVSMPSNQGSIGQFMTGSEVKAGALLGSKFGAVFGV